MKNNKIQKSISALLIIAILLPSLVMFSAPKKTEASGFPVVDVVGNILKHIGNVFANTTAITSSTTAIQAVKITLANIIKQVLMAIARRALANMTKSTVNWINSGFHGQPLFLQNPDSFFKDVTKSEVKNLIKVFGYDSARFPFGKQFALNTIDSYKRKLADNASYSLSNVINDPVLLNNYQNNFGYGGWNGFLINTQNPQNNYVGFQMLANDQLARDIQNQTQKINTTLQQGQGFLSPQTCPSNPKYNNLVNEFQKPSFKFTPPDNLIAPVPGDFLDPDNRGTENPAYVAAYDTYLTKFNASRDTAQAQWAVKNDCPGGLVTTTPGSVVSAQITKALGIPTDQASLGAALGNSLSAVFDSLLNKLVNTGLNSLASAVNPYTPPSDNFDYLGNTLGSPSGNINGGTGDIFNGPDQEIVLEKFKTKISGETDWVAKGGETITESGDTRIGTCASPKDPAGNISNDVTDISKLQCDTYKGTWTDTDGKTYQPATGKTTSIAIAGQTISELGDTSHTSTGAQIPGRTFIPGDIANTQAELNMLDNPDPSNYGITQLLALLWPKYRALDICTPGPNLGWESRLDDEMLRNTTVIQSALAQDDNAANSYKINLAAKNLQYAVDGFKDWIKNQMITPVSQGGLGLPHSTLFLDAVQDVTTLSAESTSVSGKKRDDQQILVRLQSIENSLSSFTTQPAVGSQQEKDLVTIRKQYDAISSSITNSISIEDTKSELNTLIDKNTNTNKLLAQCTAERKAPNIGWSIPASGWTKSGGEDSTLSSAQGKPFTIDFFWGKNLFALNPLHRTTKLITTTGNEKEQFCELPIVSGFTHETFVNPQDPSPDGRNVPYPTIPLVNAGGLSGLDPSGLDAQGKPSAAAPFYGAYGPLQDVNMNLSCNIIYQSNILDYKGTIPGSTATEPPHLPDVDPNSPTNNPGNGNGTPPPPTTCGGSGQIACS